MKAIMFVYKEFWSLYCGEFPISYVRNKFIFFRDYIHLNLKRFYSNYLCFVFSVFRNAYL